MTFDHTCTAVMGGWQHYKFDIGRLCGKDFSNQKGIIDDERMGAGVGVLTLRNDGRLQRKKVEVVSKTDFRAQFKKVETLAGEVFSNLTPLFPLVITFVVSLFFKGDLARGIMICSVASFILAAGKWSKSNSKFMEEADKLAQQYAIFGQQIFEQYVNRLEFKPNDIDKEKIRKLPEYSHLLENPKATEESLVRVIGIVFNKMETLKAYANETDPEAAIAEPLKTMFKKRCLVFKSQ